MRSSSVSPCMSYGSGHVDALMIFFLTLAVYCMARGWRRASLVAYGVSILSKLAPVLLVGLFLRRTRPRVMRPIAMAPT